MLLAGSVFAQTADLGIPISFNTKLQPLETLPLITTPDFDLQQALYEDSLNMIHWTGPYRFGYEHMVNIDVLTTAKREQLPNGDNVYRMVLHCPDAYTVNVQFHDFFIPDGGKLNLFTMDMTSYLGAYTSVNNNSQRLLGTEVMPGEKLVIEYYEPASVAGLSALKLGMIVHGYRNIFTFDHMVGARVNESGNCNMDVICPDGAPWASQIRSVARITVGGGLCTGALVNNTANDGKPYFLTANHCGPQSMGASVFRFNYNSPICGTGGNSQAPSTTQTVNGSVLRARRLDTDFGLIELNSVPPVSYNVYYSGWDRTGVISPNAVGIHHPSGDVKKISFDEDPLTRTAYGNNAPSPTGEHWRVGHWERNTTTEGGSSGSPLFDNNQRIIGQLHGGGAACGNTLPDWYGCFHLSWDGSAANERLRDWLDPSNTTNTLNGFDPNAPTVANDAGIFSVTSPVGVVCASNFTPVVVLRNYGSSTLTTTVINYNVDAGANQVFNWTGSLASGQSVNVTLPTMATTAGAHTFNAFTTLPNGSADGNAANDAGLSNFTLTPGGQAVSFALQTDCWGDEITWELRDNLSNLLYSGGPYGPYSTTGNAVNQNWCLAYGCYVFTINDSYGDGMHGSQYGSCSIDGTYSIASGGNTLASVIAPNADFGNQEVNSFCFNDPITLDVDLAQSNKSIAIFPNPSNGEFVITGLSSFGENAMLNIFSTDGRLVHSVNTSGADNMQLQLNLASGVYLVECADGDGKTVTRLIIGTK